MMVNVFGRWCVDSFFDITDPNYHAAARRDIQMGAMRSRTDKAKANATTK